MNGKTVLVTGSTDGVGRYVAAKLAADGAKVLIHGRDQNRAKTLDDEIRRAGRGEAIFYQADLSARGSLQQPYWRITSGSMSSSAMPGSGHERPAPSGGPARMDTNCGSP
jgi:NAD(P)-dependent dehydrogenase (short-subunit alcohol dehydrogenase family)